MVKMILNNIYKTASNTYFKRTLWGWVNSTFNKVDPTRIDEVGPDRAAAEWLLRCGASVKWKDLEHWEIDYNMLPMDNYGKYKIEQINAKDATIMSIGFPHLKGLTSLKKFTVENDGYLDDEALYLLSYVKDNLEHLEIISCIGITDAGVKSLKQLQKLKYLKLFDLPSVDNREECLQQLKKDLVNCTIEWSIAKPKKLFK